MDLEEIKNLLIDKHELYVNACNEAYDKRNKAEAYGWQYAYSVIDNLYGDIFGHPITYTPEEAEEIRIKSRNYYE